MSEENLDAWYEAYQKRTQAALNLAAAHARQDGEGVEHYAELYAAADETMTRLNREFLGENK